MNDTGALGPGQEDGSPARFTPQRRAIEAAISGFGDFRSAQDIHSVLRDSGQQVSLATVYRGVQWLVEAGRVDTVMNDAGESLYRQCSRTHHHHLVCRHCGRTVEIEGPAAETWAASVADQFGFVDVNHTMELFGTCASCRLARGEQTA